MSFGIVDLLFDLQSLALDFFILALTIISARVLTHTLSKKGAFPAESSGCQQQGKLPSFVSSKQKTSTVHDRADATLTQDTETALNKSFDLPPSERLPDMYEEVVLALQECQRGNTCSVNRILGLYADLRQSLIRSKQTLAAVAERSRQKPMHFYSMLLRHVIQTSKQDLVEPILDDMVKQGVQRTTSFYESVMKQLASQKLFPQALRIHDRLEQDGLEVSAECCSCLVRFAAEVGELHRAIDFFGKLSSKSTPSIRACMTILGVHNKLQDWHSTLATIQLMRTKGVHVDSLSLNVALSTGVFADKAEAVESILAEAESIEPFAPDVISYNTLLKVFAQRSMHEEATKVVERMGRFNIRPDVITFNTVIDAAVRAGKYPDAWDVLSDIRFHGLRPDKYTFLILVNSVSKSMMNPNQAEATINRALVLLRSADGLDASLRASLYYSVAQSTLQAERRALLSKVVLQMQRNNVVVTPTLQKATDKALRQKV